MNKLLLVFISLVVSCTHKCDCVDLSLGKKLLCCNGKWKATVTEISDISSFNLKLNHQESADSFELIFYNDTLAYKNGNKTTYVVNESGTTPLFAFEGRVFNVRSNINMEIVLSYSQSYTIFIPSKPYSLTYSYEKIVTLTKVTE